jgi:hypothetical protein
MDKKQTAIQWLYAELAQCLHREEVCDLVYKLEQKAKEMEREQIYAAHNDGYSCGIYQEGSQFEYYNETFGGQDER